MNYVSNEFGINNIIAELEQTSSKTRYTNNNQSNLDLANY
jgi:hypothetical protein